MEIVGSSPVLDLPEPWLHNGRKTCFLAFMLEQTFRMNLGTTQGPESDRPWTQRGLRPALSGAWLCYRHHHHYSSPLPPLPAPPPPPPRGTDTGCSHSELLGCDPMLMLEATIEEGDTSSATQLPQALHRRDCGSPARHPSAPGGASPCPGGFEEPRAATGREHSGTRLREE